MLIAHEGLIRVGAFLAFFTTLAVLEIVAPRRTLRAPKGKRWFTNLGVLITDTLLVRALFPAAAVGIALVAEEHQIGLLHQVAFPPLVEIIVALVLLDLAIYVQHVVFHVTPVLWRLHRAHHADLDIDVTTGTRFHPIEMVLSMLIKTAVIFSIGAPALAAFLFELALNLTSMFSHSNVRIPPRLEVPLRAVLVTPDMHRIHHSLHPEETARNFAFNLSLWDRLFRTYKAEPRDGHNDMAIGIPAFRSEEDCATLLGTLAIPFQKGISVRSDSDASGRELET
jgi:sterol desaturase/sphingolipid hydroxylase (fatty acid hydroxylase superfamily)